MNSACHATCTCSEMKQGPAPQTSARPARRDTSRGGGRRGARLRATTRAGLTPPPAPTVPNGPALAATDTVACQAEHAGREGARASRQELLRPPACQ